VPAVALQEATLNHKGRAAYSMQPKPAHTTPNTSRFQSQQNLPQACLPMNLRPSFFTSSTTSSASLCSPLVCIECT
jgi:hypothetical protein